MEVKKMNLGEGCKPATLLGILILTLFARYPQSYSRDDHADRIADSTRRQPGSSTARSGLVQSTSTTEAVLVGAGDIADCADLSGAEATAKLLDGIAGIVFTAGDNAYEGGTAEQFASATIPPGAGRRGGRAPPSATTSSIPAAQLPTSIILALQRAIQPRATTATNSERGTSWCSIANAPTLEVASKVLWKKNGC